MWELDHKESWAPKNWCFWIVVLEKTLESPLDCKEIQPVNPEGNQSWIFIGGQYFGHLMRRTDSLEKTMTLGKIERRKRREQQRMRRLDGITDLRNMREAWRATVHRVAKRVGHNWATELSYYTMILYCQFITYLSI